MDIYTKIKDIDLDKKILFLSCLIMVIFGVLPSMICQNWEWLLFASRIRETSSVNLKVSILSGEDHQSIRRAALYCRSTDLKRWAPI